jgi:anti-anti-sigma factor
MTDQALRVHVQAGPPGITLLVADGELDHDSRRILQRNARDVLDAGGTRLVIDLTAVTFCDSGGLSLFVELHRQAENAGGWVRLAGAQGMVLSVLKTTNLDRMFVLYDSADAAVADA